MGQKLGFDLVPGIEYFSLNAVDHKLDSTSVVFNLFAKAEPQGNIPVARGTPVL